MTAIPFRHEQVTLGTAAVCPLCEKPIRPGSAERIRWLDSPASEDRAAVYAFGYFHEGDCSGAVLEVLAESRKRVTRRREAKGSRA
jgi:hypothetical protein